MSKKIYEVDFNGDLFIIGDDDVISISYCENEDDYTLASGTAMHVAEYLGAEYEVVELTSKQMTSDIVFHLNAITSGETNDTKAFAKAFHAALTQ